MYCYIFCFLPLYLYLLTAAPVSVLFVSLITPLFFYKHLFFFYLVIYIDQAYTPSLFSGRMASFPRYCMSFATSLCQSDQ